MAETLHSIGSPRGLQFDLRWLDLSGTERAPSYGSLIAWAAGKLVWGQTDENGQVKGIEWFWDDLLSQLARSWKYLLLEEAYPMGLLPLAPQLLRSVLSETRIGSSEEMINAEDNSVFAFEEIHDLARGIEGATLPSFFLLREGELMLVATVLGVERVAFSAAIAALAQLGDLIAERIKNDSDEKIKEILQAWHARTDISDHDQVEIASGLPRSTIDSITGGEEFKKFWEVSSTADTQPNELMAAARMVGRVVSNDDARIILNGIKTVSKFKTPILDKLSVEAVKVVEALNTRMPHEQGRSLAEWLRRQPDIVAKDGLVDPEKMLKGWNVGLNEIVLQSQNVDALCAWGANHGPIVLLNRTGRLSHYPTGKRSSLAHEICHLLVDRGGSLPLAEVFGGEVPKVPEQRANGFAAELLLPRERAKALFIKLRDVETTLEQLAKSYNVSFEVAAWQLSNSGVDLSTSQRQLLLKHTYRYNLTS